MTVKRQDIVKHETLIVDSHIIHDTCYIVESMGRLQSDFQPEKDLLEHR